MLQSMDDELALIVGAEARGVEQAVAGVAAGTALQYSRDLSELLTRRIAAAQALLARAQFEGGTV